MKKIFTKNRVVILVLALLTMGWASSAIAQEQYREYKGTVSSMSGKDLAHASLTIEGANISTVTNTEGEFALKVPQDDKYQAVIVSLVGYQQKRLVLSDLKPKKNKIFLEESVIELSDVNIDIPADAKELVRKVFKKKEDNYITDQTLMTAFYRETIKKRKRNASLSEAVVNVYKQPYSIGKDDAITLYKARKSTDYSRLDTIALKLQGGPFNALYVDMMKYPEYIFVDRNIDYYSYSFGPSTVINDKKVYVINFTQLPTIAVPLYYGQLFVDAETLALTSALYNLKIDNKEKASKIFVRKKPRNVNVYPTVASYKVDYREKDGKWYYGYSNIQLTFKVDWKNKLFNSTYSLTSEMAVTDWEKDLTSDLRGKNKLSPRIVITDEISGFSDPEFWGEYNVIEPEKSIESAINKIQKKIRRDNRRNGGTSAP